MALAYTVRTKKSEKDELKSGGTECLQNLYQSVAIQLKDGTYGTLISSTKVFSLLTPQNSLTTPPKRSFT